MSSVYFLGCLKSQQEAKCFSRTKWNSAQSEKEFSRALNKSACDPFRNAPPVPTRNVVREEEWGLGGGVLGGGGSVSNHDRRAQSSEATWSERECFHTRLGEPWLLVIMMT